MVRRSSLSAKLQGLLQDALTDTAHTESGTIRANQAPAGHVLIGRFILFLLRIDAPSHNLIISDTWRAQMNEICRGLGIFLGVRRHSRNVPYSIHLVESSFVPSRVDFHLRRLFLLIKKNYKTNEATFQQNPNLLSISLHCQRYFPRDGVRVSAAK